MNRSKDKHPAREEPEKHRPKVAEDSPAGVQAEPPAAAPDPAAELAAVREQLLRLRADFDNFRKRTLRDRQEICETAAADLMLEILPVLDHFQLGLQAAAGHEAVQEGFRLVFEQLMAGLAKFGLEPFDAENQPFDPARCEAVSCLPSDQAPEGRVLAQTRRGYFLRGRLLRPAQVVVSAGKARAQAAPGPAPAEAPEKEG